MKANTSIKGGAETEDISSYVEEPLIIGSTYDLVMPIPLGEASEQTADEKVAFVSEQLLKESVIHLQQKYQSAIAQNLEMRGLEVKQC